MLRLLTGLLLFASLNAMAQMDESAKGGPHNASVIAGFNAGGFALGVGYEFLYKDSMGVGAHLRWFNKEESTKNPSSGLFIIGASAAHHFYKKNWDLSFAPSFNIINVDSVDTRKEDATGFGPGISVALLCQVNSAIAIGFDWSNYWMWFDKDYAGKIIDDLGVKARMSF